MAGYGLQKEQAFPAQLEKKLNQTSNKTIAVINAGISGETTAGGAQRAKWAVNTFNPTDVIIVLGGNDMLRSFPPRNIKANLKTIIQEFENNNINIILAGMKAPLNLGAAYQQELEVMYEELHQQHNIHIYPWFFEGVWGKTELMLNDAIHPNEEGIKVIVEKILPLINKILHEN